MNRHRIIIATLALLTILSACNPITNPTASRESGPRGSGASARITPIPAERFDFPLDPTRFGPYVYNVTGPLNVDTRFGAQNPGLGNAGKCFVDFDGNRVPFNQLYHAGEDWFALNSQGLIVSGLAANAAVFAVAHGVVSWIGGSTHIYTGKFVPGEMALIYSPLIRLVAGGHVTVERRRWPTHGTTIHFGQYPSPGAITIQHNLSSIIVDHTTNSQPNIRLTQTVSIC